MKNYKTVRGTYDILPQDVRKWQALEKTIFDICKVYDYQEIRTPIFEDTAVFKRENDTSDMVNKEMYTFSINDKDSLTLRPEGTAGVVRSYVEHKYYAAADLPQKFYYYGPMFRYERPQKGRQRMFHQFGVENIGMKDPIIDAETIAFGYTILKAINISGVKVLINTLGDAESREAYKAALKEHFKDNLDELCFDCNNRYETNPLRLLDCKVDHELEIMKSVPKYSDYLTAESKDYFDKVLTNLDALEIPYEIDEKLVRGLDYYSDTVFEVVSLNKDSGSQATIFAGGRYDNLVNYFNGPEQSGIGFAMGMERLLILAEAEGIELVDDKEIDCYVMSMGEVGTLPLEVATILRAYGFVTEFNIAKRSMKAQFKSVDRYKANFAIIIGEDEAINQQLTVKNLISKEQKVIKFEEIIDYIDEEMEKINETHSH